MVQRSSPGGIHCSPNPVTIRVKGAWTPLSPPASFSLSPSPPHTPRLPEALCPLLIRFPQLQPHCLPLTYSWAWGSLLGASWAPLTLARPHLSSYFSFWLFCSLYPPHSPHSVPSTGLGWQTVMLNKCLMSSIHRQMKDHANNSLRPFLRLSTDTCHSTLKASSPGQRGRGGDIHMASIKEFQRRTACPGNRGTKGRRIHSLTPCSPQGPGRILRLKPSSAV